MLTHAKTFLIGLISDTTPKDSFSDWDAVHTMPEKLDNSVFTLKRIKGFSSTLHQPEKFEQATISGLFWICV